MPAPDNSNLFECLRFGSSIPGGYWGCCAGDIMQCFKSDPDELASIQFVNGDGGEPQTDADGNLLFAGPTNKDVFLARLRDGTFGSGDMANHFFIAVLTNKQLHTGHGMKWLAILKEHGFEFIRTVSNSVYTGSSVKTEPPTGAGRSLNHVFALFRGIAQGAPEDAFTPPKAWTDLPKVKTTLADLAKEPDGEDTFDYKWLTGQQAKEDIEIWNRIGKAKLLTEEQIREAGAPVIFAAIRTENPQEEAEIRRARDAAKGKKKEVSLRAPSPEAGSPTPPVEG